MNVPYPRIPLRLLPAMFGHALLGAVLAGLYGILHDQITYSISPEYFTRLKFSQFHYANFGFPPSVFVAEIGFLATWWVGFVAAWFLARVTVPAFPPRLALRHTAQGFLFVVVFALAAFGIGYFLGILRTSHSDCSEWNEIALSLGIRDMPSFVRVAYIHNAGYLGGLAGLIAGVIYVQQKR
jgi:hypothetical protein